MKIPTMLSLSDDVVAALRALAKAEDRPLSRIADVYLREALALPLPAHEPSKETTLTEKDQLVRRGIQRLIQTAKEKAEELGTHPEVAFSLKEISRAAGKYPSETRGALRKLEWLGYVVCHNSFHGTGPSELFSLPPVDMCLPDGRLDREKQARLEALARGK